MGTNPRRDWLLSWFPVFSLYLGLIGIIFASVVWLLTNRTSTPLIGLFGSMIGVGVFGNTVKELSAGPKRQKDTSE